MHLRHVAPLHTRCQHRQREAHGHGGRGLRGLAQCAYKRTQPAGQSLFFRDLLRVARQYSPRQFVVLAAPDVVDAMLDQESTSVAQLEAFIGIPIKFQAEALYPREQYDVVLM